MEPENNTQANAIKASDIISKLDQIIFGVQQLNNNIILLNENLKNLHISKPVPQQENITPVVPTPQQQISIQDYINSQNGQSSAVQQPPLLQTGGSHPAPPSPPPSQNGYIQMPPPPSVDPNQKVVNTNPNPEMVEQIAEVKRKQLMKQFPALKNPEWTGVSEGVEVPSDVMANLNQQHQQRLNQQTGGKNVLDMIGRNNG